MYLILSSNKQRGNLIGNVWKREIGNEIAKTRLSKDLYSDS